MTEKRIFINEFKFNHYKPKGDFFIKKDYKNNCLYFFGRLQNFCNKYNYIELPKHAGYKITLK